MTTDIEYYECDFCGEKYHGENKKWLRQFGFDGEVYQTCKADCTAKAVTNLMKDLTITGEEIKNDPS